MTNHRTARGRSRPWMLLVVLTAWVAVPAPAQPVAPHPAAPGAQPAPAARAAEAPALCERVVTIGASLTCGFGNRLPLAEPLDRAVTGPHVRVFNAGEALHFMDPVGLGEVQVDHCLARRATLVIGVDFLFWYAYGIAFKGETEWPRRSSRFAEGLRQLDRISCPIVVGDLPDVRGADPRMLHPAMIPSPEVLVRLNTTLRDWAADRKHVHVFPLAGWVRSLNAGEWIVPASPDGKHAARTLTPDVAMQWDRLHPSRAGTLVLVARLVAWMREHLGPGADRFRCDLWRELTRYGRWPEAPPSDPPARAPRAPASSPHPPSDSGR